MKTASGGRLVLTDRRIFQPGRVDTMFRERIWEKPLEEIDGFEIVGPDGEVFGGGMRNRLGIRSGDELEVPAAVAVGASGPCFIDLHQ